MTDLPIYYYCPEKNTKLKLERDISFEEIIAAIDDDQLCRLKNLCCSS